MLCAGNLNLERQPELTILAPFCLLRRATHTCTKHGSFTEIPRGRDRLIDLIF